MLSRAEVLSDLSMKTAQFVPSLAAQLFSKNRFLWITEYGEKSSVKINESPE
jgi:hypothetical protein